TGRKPPGPAAPAGGSRTDYIAEHPVHGVLVKNSKISVREQIHLQSLQLQAHFAWFVSDRDLAIVRKSGLRAHGRIFRELDGNLVTGEMVGPRFQLGQARGDSRP